MLHKMNFDFYPVGQGLFATGRLTTEPAQRREFVWVYDCGTTSSAGCLNQALNSFLTSIGVPRPRIGLLALSHFDRDHISGCTSLLGRADVDTLLLPYIPLWQRLILAFVEGVNVGETLMAFFVDPARYLAQLGDAQVRRVVFVPGSTGSVPPQMDGPANEPPRANKFPQDIPPWELTVDVENPVGAESASDLAAFRASTSGKVLVEFMRPRGTMRIANVFEFVPYNDVSVSPYPSAAFRGDVAREQNVLLDPATTEQRRTAILKKLRKKYDHHFGAGSKMRNIISLFLYAGPATGDQLSEAAYCDAMFASTPASGVFHRTGCPQAVWMMAS